MNYRLRSIDVLRGAVMVLMAIDQVRVYSGLPAGGPEPGIFFTRWVTHSCAPAFVFFAGTGAFLHGIKHGRDKLAHYLLTRGLLVPWIGVMMAGYGFGAILLMEPERMERICWWIGFSAIIIFLGWGSVVATSAGDGPFLFRLLAQRKYPASVHTYQRIIGGVPKERRHFPRMVCHGPLCLGSSRTAMEFRNALPCIFN